MQWTFSARLSPLRIKFQFIGLALIFLCTFSNAHAEVSGVYIGTTPNIVELVQIVKTPDGRIAGRIESTVLDENGELETSAFTIEGAADGKQVILSTKSILFSGDISLTGFVDKDLLDLSWPEGRRTYQRGDSYDYQAAVTGLKERSLQIHVENAEKKARANYSELLKVLSIIESNKSFASFQLSKFGVQYEKLYSRYYDRQRRANFLWDSGGSTATASRLDREAVRTQQEIFRLDRTVHTFHSNLKQKFDASRDLTASIKTYCAEYDQVRANNLCKEIPAQESRMEQLIDNPLADYDALLRAAETASVDVPPGEKLLKKIFD
ncbi:MAG: hypothetical protein DHS20C05_06960 [Hyphococcus sp.]|nr:MAG: hypothetical protein DHS20C05_06960 [Marinicaulis sp.]